ncbi:hypothetical protein P775_19710 [Puniceibacterium antarcticum]|uniref:DUF4345 domain-containing protein n=1 Tax=Puniceibacterium antarcticum TaxID=1206336 RepID=A0A2G8RCH1_9RHOB|nr:DUF4345 family protein [Puniceibacterium antarcticum]PIL18798.1 hypothetical protein P775_19710 [Puniceibacterium antarcticum]
MTDILNLACALLTAAFGLFGFLAPRYTAQVLDLAPTRTNMGLSEMRASAGGLFLALGLGCILIATPMAYAMMGVAYAGAAAGRALSMTLDNPPQPKAFLYFAFEAIFAVWLLYANL